jgi:hypothetical protein
MVSHSGSIHNVVRLCMYTGKSSFSLLFLFLLTFIFMCRVIINDVSSYINVLVRRY